VSDPIGLTWEQLDELADFAEGVLDGPAAARAAVLVGTDNRWAAALTGLRGAAPATVAALQTAAQASMAIPADVAARLDSALALGQSRPGDGPTRPLGGGSPAGRPDAATRPSSTGPGRRAQRRRTARIVVGILALVVLVGGGGLTLARALRVPLSSTSNSAAGAAAPDRPRPELATTPTGDVPGEATGAARPRLLASGTDYRQDTLHLLVDAPPAAPTLTLNTDKAGTSVTGALAGLTTEGGFTACVASVGRVHTGQVTLADYARYDGQPALVLVVVSGKTSTVIAVGPGCGGAGADELAAVNVP
jgi:hypothetical protein